MKAPLDRLVDLRESEVQRLTAEMAARELLRQRYLGNIARLQRLGETGPAKGHVTLAHNSGEFKAALLQMSQAHRDELSHHEAQMAGARLLLQRASQRHEALRQCAERRHASDRRHADGREQRDQDELAAQCWQRTKTRRFSRNLFQSLSPEPALHCLEPEMEPTMSFERCWIGVSLPAFLGREDAKKDKGREEDLERPWRPSRSFATSRPHNVRVVASAGVTRHEWHVSAVEN